MLAIILVLYHRLQLAEALGERAAGRGALIGAAIGIAAPVQIDLGQIVTALPQTPVDGVLHTGAIGAGFGAKHPPASLTRRQFRGQPFALQLRAFLAHFGRQRVHVIRLVQCCHSLHGRIEEANKVGKRIAEEPRHPQRDIHPRPVEQAHRQDFKVVHALTASGPHRAHAHQRHGLGDIVATGAHGGRAPDGQPQLSQMITVILQVALKDQIGGLETDAPRGGGRQVAHVHREKIAPCGQYIQPPATRCPTGPGWHEATLERVEHALHLGGAAGVEPGCNHLQQGVKNAPHLGPLIVAGQCQCACQRVFDQPGGIQLKALAGVASGAPQGIADGQQWRRASRGPGFGQRTIERIETQAERLGQRP